MKRPDMQNSIKVPKHLEKTTAEWWLSVVAEYELDAHHVRLLTLACEAWDRGQEARKILDKEGLTFLDFRGQPKLRPEASVERDSRIGFARLVRELGLDLVSPEDSRPPRIGGRK